MRTRSFSAWGALLLTAAGCREIEAPTEPDVTLTPALAAAAELTFLQVSAGGVHTCSLTMENRAYCWGSGSGLGDGSETPAFQYRPVPVAGTLRFRQISAGYDFTCAVTTDYRAYCWGWNGYGQLGDGTTAWEWVTPTAVAGGLRFRQVETGHLHTCGVTYPDGRAYCWGYNHWGQLGDGTTTDRSRPVAVLGGRAFRQVSTGENHTCGASTADRAWCWGANYMGQLGDSTEVRRRQRPVLVAGGREFRRVDAGWSHTCALTANGRAFCWGNGRYGPLGNGRAYLSYWPRAVSGGLVFSRLSAGSGHTCGETSTNRVYCWGSNYPGQLGDGTTITRYVPVAVTGGLRFSQMSAGTYHTCARTPEGRGYCWGGNGSGQLGDGTQVDHLNPNPVAAP